jgi:hypothetical protein
MPDIDAENIAVIEKFRRTNLAVPGAPLLEPPSIPDVPPTLVRGSSGPLLRVKERRPLVDVPK